MFNNLLNQAFRVIPQQNFTYYKYKSNTINDYGIKVNVYETGIDFKGSVQAVDSKMYQQFGLDVSKKYIQIFSSLNIQNVEGQEAPDKVNWNGKDYNVVNCTDWYKQDGWTNIIAVEIEDDNSQSNL